MRTHHQVNQSRPLYKRVYSIPVSKPKQQTYQDQQWQASHCQDKLNIINDEYDDWRSEITKWFNKWVTDDYSIKSKKLFLYGEHNTEFKAFINNDG